MSIGFAEKADWPALREIWLSSFSDGPEYWEWLRRCLWRPEQTLVLRENGQIVSCLLLFPCVFAPGELSAQYIYAVATAPAFRGGGRMASLLAFAAERGRRSGADLSVLLTEEDSLQGYYARFGYRPVCVWAQRPTEKVSLRGKCRPMAADDLPAAAALYARACAKLTAVWRTAEDWRLQRDLFAGGAVVAEQGGILSAYCFYDERGVLEAAGPEAPALAYACAPDKPVWLTLPEPGETGRPAGCALPLTERGEAALARGPLYLNLMLN